MQRSYYAIIPANVRYDKELPPNAKLLYGEITALCNEKGYCWATNSYFSDLYKVHNKSISRLISQLEKKRYIDIELIMEGKEVKSRHIYIAPSNNNEDTYPQKSVEGSNKNVTRGGNKIVTENNTPFNTTNNNAYSNEFEQFWSIYPKKIEKKQAYTKFKTCLKKHSLEKILKGTEKYALQAKNTDKKYIKHPATFLNNESYIDGFEEVQEKEIPKQPVYETQGALTGMWGEDE